MRSLYFASYTFHVHAGARTDSYVRTAGRGVQARDIIGKMASNCGEVSGLLVFSADQFQERYKRSVSKRHFAYRNERDSCENHNDNFSQFWRRPFEKIP